MNFLNVQIIKIISLITLFSSPDSNSNGPDPAPTGSVELSLQMRVNGQRALFIGALSSADQDPTSVPAVTGQRAVGQLLVAQVQMEESVLNASNQIEPLTFADVLEQVFSELQPTRCVFADLRNNTGKYSKATLTLVRIAIELAAGALALSRDSNTAFHNTGAKKARKVNEFTIYVKRKDLKLLEGHGLHDLKETKEMEFLMATGQKKMNYEQIEHFDAKMITTTKISIALQFFIVYILTDSLLAISNSQCTNSALKAELSNNLPEANCNFQETSSTVDQSYDSHTAMAAQSARAAAFKSELRKTWALIQNATFIPSVTALDIRAQGFEFIQPLNLFAYDLAQSERYSESLNDLFTVASDLAQDALQISYEAVDLYHSLGKSNAKDPKLQSEFKDVLYTMLQLTYDLTTLIGYIATSLTKNPAAVSEYTLESRAKSIINDSKKLYSGTFCFIDKAGPYLQ